MRVLHDKETTSLFGCLPQDMYIISTGRAAPASTSSTATLLEALPSHIGDAGKAKHYPSSVCSETERISIDLGDSDIDMDGDDESEWDTINVDDDDNAADLSLTEDCIKLVSVGVQTDIVEVRLHTHIYPHQIHSHIHIYARTNTGTLTL